jgi:hypothetical protein
MPRGGGNEEDHEEKNATQDDNDFFQAGVHPQIMAALPRICQISLSSGLTAGRGKA